MSLAPLISIAFVIAGEGSPPSRFLYHLRTTAAAPLTTGAAKLVPSRMPYLTPSGDAMLKLQKTPSGLKVGSPLMHSLAGSGSGPRDTGPVTRVLGATRSGFTTVVKAPPTIG